MAPVFYMVALLAVFIITLRLSAAGLAATLYHTGSRILPSRLDHSASATRALALTEGYFEMTAVAPPPINSKAPSTKVHSVNLTVAPD